MKLLTIIGTRPEAIKMAPVLLALSARSGVVSLLCATGQHGSLADQALDFFGVAPDFRLDLSGPDQPLNRFTGRALDALDALLDGQRPDLVLVHGDTSSALAGALAAFNRSIPVAHVEAGLRSGDPASPWPEERYRRWIDLGADFLLAPTPAAAANLERESPHGAVHVTGNSGIDALHLVLDRLAREPRLRRAADAPLPARGDRPLLLVTMHRRESIGAGVEGICRALAHLADSGLADLAIPIHPNPAFGAPLAAALSGRANVHLLPPLPVAAMVRLMQRCDLILTDSGGLQEEAPSLGKPVIVLRDVTERREAVEAGLARLAGTDTDRIVAETEAMLEQLADQPLRAVVANPFGDGRASARIAAALCGEPYEPFGFATLTSSGAPLRLAV